MTKLHLVPTPGSAAAWHRCAPLWRIGALSLALLLVVTGPSVSQAVADDTNGDSGEWVELKKGVKIKDLVVGDGDEVKRGKNVSVHYTGWLEDGTKFDSSYDSGASYAFKLGDGRVVQGWEIGLIGMRKGGKRQILVPPKMGYGGRGVPGRIPKNATLLFEIELLAVF